MKYDIYFALVSVAKFHKSRGLPDPEAIWKELRLQGQRGGLLWGKIQAAQRKVALDRSTATPEDLYILFVCREYPQVRYKILAGEEFSLDDFPILKQLYESLASVSSVERGDEDEEKAAINAEW